MGEAGFWKQDCSKCERQPCLTADGQAQEKENISAPPIAVGADAWQQEDIRQLIRTNQPHHRRYTYPSNDVKCQPDDGWVKDCEQLPPFPT
jgi:hypothetical protein